MSGFLDTLVDIAKGASGGVTMTGALTYAEAEALASVIGKMVGQIPTVTQDQTGDKTIYTLAFKDEGAAINAISNMIDRQKQKLTTSSNSDVRLDMGGVWSGVVIKQYGIKALVILGAAGTLGYMIGKSRSK